MLGEVLEPRGVVVKTKVVQDQADGPGLSRNIPEPVISAVGLSKTFGHVNALTEVDLTVPRNSIVGFLGPNGAGKTTAIKLLLGLSRPTGGKATLFGLDSERESLAIRARVGYLAQDPRFYTHLTARETLRFTARFFYQGPKKAIDHRIEETLALVGLEDKADRPTKGFSGGERQRLGIAQAQINYPDLLILDEPAAALDPVGRRDVLDVMERLRAHTTIFYSTHILDDVQRVSDYVTILDHGRLVTSAPTETLLDGDAATYEISFKGNAPAVLAAVRAHPWVSDTSTHSVNGATAVTVSVSDERAAEAELLRSVMVLDGVVVKAFGRRQYNLEEVFLQLVKGHGE
jgi:ABC-2 type transport system ATP-binding protein